MNKSYVVSIQYDEETGDQVIPLPEELLLELNWLPGDTIIWKPQEDGSFILSKQEIDNA